MPILPTESWSWYHTDLRRHSLALRCPFSEVPDVFKPKLQQSPRCSSKHGVYHHINMTGLLTHAKLRCFPPHKVRDAKRTFEDMEWIGICKKASSPWAFPLHMVKKPDGKWRPCGDYRRLNLIKTLVQCRRELPVFPEDVPKTAIIMPFGSYAFS
ncbi:uncharacterized protein [Palaemon carinicauda]|uniref:uncharacterized protein n=1 Tax=Palaemon carinicauda TaxID=392227 RepID=UPI0035B6597A